jgi:glutathione S-transferase
MLKLYHSATSVCAIKVRLTLEEKALAWTGELLSLQRGDQYRPEYLKLNPNAVVPTLVHDGRVLIESTLIIEYLDEAFPEPALMPREPYRRALARLWMKKIDDSLHAACSTLTFAIAFRNRFLGLSPQALEERLARIPNPAYRERQRLSIAHGVDAPHVADAVRAYDRYFAEMELALERSDYLAGDEYSLADVAVTSYINRARMLAMDRLMADRPRLAAWFERVKSRPSFGRAITSWFTEDDARRFSTDPNEVAEKLNRILSATPA